MTHELQTRQQWVVYLLEPRVQQDGTTKLEKIPHNARTGYPASTTKREDWSSYEQARRGLESRRTPDGKGFSGVGFVFNDDYIGIDLDHCIDEGGQVDAWAQAILDRIHSYAEVSPSGTGIHIIVAGKLTGKGRKFPLQGKRDPKAAVEMYSVGRFFTLTGNALKETHPIADQQEQARTLYIELSDKQIIEKASRAKNGVAFTRLWQGDTTGYASPSEAELALCSHLAFYVKNDKEAVDRLYRRSKLYRPKWETDIYRELTIEKATGGNAPSVNGHQPQETARSFPCTDLGNAERFATRYKGTVRWCETWNAWMIYNGKCWEPDRTGEVDRLAKKVVRSIYREITEGMPHDEIVAIRKHAVASESNRAVRAMLDRAKSELPCTPEEFNRDIHVLNFANGTVDLRTGVLRPHSASDMLTRCLSVAYNPTAQAQLWTAFLDTILANNAELIAFIKQALGMSLSGDISEQCLFICHGDGNNGKTTMLEVVRIILASYGLAANIETFQVHKNERINNDVAELYGARFVTAEENTMGSRLNEAFIKKMTGKQPLRARRLHENEFEFMPEFTTWLAVNHKPMIKDHSKGMWRRVHFIPFAVTIPDEQVDQHMCEKLLEQSEGILSWLVAGCVAWYKHGRLQIPQVVREATIAYRSEMDMIARLIAECCVESPQAAVEAARLYEVYKRWCEQSGERCESGTAFGLLITARGYRKAQNSKGRRVYRGIGLLDNTPTPEQSTIEVETPIEGTEGQRVTEGYSYRDTCKKYDMPIYRELPSVPSTPSVNDSKKEEKNESKNGSEYYPHYPRRVPNEPVEPIQVADSSNTLSATSPEIAQLTRVQEIIANKPLATVHWAERNSGFKSGAVSKPEYMRRLRDCLGSGDRRRIESAQEEMARHL